LKHQQIRLFSRNEAFSDGTSTNPGTLRPRTTLTPHNAAI
jgi:hypothetical protein